MILADKLLQELRARSLMLATAESCTGGLVAAALTEVAGSSDCFGYGLVTYSNQAKEQLLQVPPQLLVQYGAVSAETATAMVQGLRRLTAADIGLSITGIAGPGGGSAEKPVGLVYMAAADAERLLVQEHRLSGSREQIRRASVEAALQLVLSLLEQNTAKEETQYD